MDYVEYFKLNMNYIAPAILGFVACFLISKIVNKNTKNLPPGPYGIPFLGYLTCARSDAYKILFKLREKYGDIMGFHFGAHYIVVINEFTAMKEILCHQSALNRLNIFGLIPTGFATMNGEEWQEQRRFCMNSLHSIGFGKEIQENFMQDYLQMFIRSIKSHKGGPLDVKSILYDSTICNIMSILTGRKFDPVVEADKIHILKLICHFINKSPVFNIRTVIPGLYTIFKLLGKQSKAMEENIYSYIQFLREEINERRFEDKGKIDGDFIYLYDQRIQDKRIANSRHFFNDENLLGNFSGLFIGSADTTDISIYWLIRLMAKYPDIQRKVQGELDSVTENNEAISYSERYRVPYAFAVILEAQRFMSLGKFAFPRIAKENFEFKGYVIPKGAVIATNLWGINNDPKYWRNPELFQPERFIQDGKLVENLPSFAPFSIGKRKCPGEKIALMMLFAYFTSIMRTFKVMPLPGEEVSLETIKGFMEDLIPQELRFQERLI